MLQFRLYSTACLSVFLHCLQLLCVTICCLVLPVCLSPLSLAALCYSFLYSTGSVVSVFICFVLGTICCIVLYVCLSSAALCYNSLHNTLRILWAGCTKNRCRAAVASVACCGIVRCGAARRACYIRHAVLVSPELPDRLMRVRQTRIKAR